MFYIFYVVPSFLYFEYQYNLILKIKTIITYDVLTFIYPLLYYRITLSDHFFDIDHCYL